MTGATLTLDEALNPDAVPPTDRFAVIIRDATNSDPVRTIEVNEVVIEGATVTLTLASPVYPGEEHILVQYSPPPEYANKIQDAIGNALETRRGWFPTNTRLAPGVAEVAFTNQPSGRYATPGSPIEVTVTFNEDVTVSGAPRIPLTPAFGPGGETRYADYVSGSPGTALVFRYTLVQGDYSSGANVSVAARALDADGASGSASIRATADGTDVSTEHAAYDSGKSVSTGVPTITQALGSDALTTDADLDGTGDTYIKDDTFSVILSFSNDIVVANIGNNGENARIVVAVGDNEYTLNHTGQTDDSVTFGAHTVVAGDNDADGITVKRDASGNLVRLSGSPGATIRSKDNGNDAVLTAAADLLIWAVADVPARVRGTNLAPSGEDFTRTTAINVDLTFAKSDFKITDSDGDPLKEIRVLTLPDSAHGVLKLDGTAILTTDLPRTVTHTELDDGKLVFTPALDYEGDASFTFKVVDSLDAAAASANTASISVVPLRVTGVEITSTPSRDGDGASDTYLLGNKVRVRLTFNESVDVDTAGGRPRLKIRMDRLYGEKWAVYESGSDTLTFVHPVAWPNKSTQGIAEPGPFSFQGKP